MQSILSMVQMNTNKKHSPDTVPSQAVFVISTIIFKAKITLFIPLQFLNVSYPIRYYCAPRRVIQEMCTAGAGPAFQSAFPQ